MEDWLDIGMMFGVLKLRIKLKDELSLLIKLSSVVMNRFGGICQAADCIVLLE